MTEPAIRPIVLVGYSGAWQHALAAHDPDGRYIFVEEPDVIRKRSLEDEIDGAGGAFALTGWEYQLPTAADRFYLAHRDLAPVAVIPVIEYGVPFAARLAERYGLPGAGFGAAQLLRNKRLLRLASSAAGVANPRSVPVSSPDEVRAFMVSCGRSVIVKPANRQASVGTQVVDRVEDIEAVWGECLEQDEGVVVPDRPMPLEMLVEEFVEGTEFSVEMIVSDGRPVIANVTQKLLFPGPKPVELGHLVPAPLPTRERKLLCGETRRMLDAVGFATGYVHCEWIVSRGLPHLVECAGRMPGDFIVPLIDRAWGVDSLSLFLAVMRGEPLGAEPPRFARGGAAIRYFAAEPGEVVSVSGLEAARAAEGVLQADVGVAPGDRTHAVASSWDRAGMVIAEARDSRAAMERALAATALIRVDVVADPVAQPAI